MSFSYICSEVFSSLSFCKLLWLITKLTNTYSFLLRNFGHVILNFRTKWSILLSLPNALGITDGASAASFMFTAFYTILPFYCVCPSLILFQYGSDPVANKGKGTLLPTLGAGFCFDLVTIAYWNSRTK